MLKFFSNKQKYVTGQNTKTLFDEQSLGIIIDMGYIHLGIPKDNKLYYGRLFCEQDGMLIFINYDGLVLISVTVAGNKVRKIGIHNSNNNLNKSVIYEQIINYNDIYHKIESKKVSDDGQIIVVRRDRGNKISLLTRPEYDIACIQKLFKDDLYRFDSYYLTWLRFYTIGQDIELPMLVSVLKAMQDKNMLDLVMLADRMQCLGIALCLSELADRFSINTELSDYDVVMSHLVKYAFFAIMIYIATYKGIDTLKDTELLAIQGRLCDLHKARLVTMLMDCGITNMAFIDKMYVYCMYSASQCSPNVFLKTEYYKNALMMYSNQTLVGVTKDCMDDSFLECVNYGMYCMNQLIGKMPALFKSGHLSIPEIILRDIDSGIEKIVQSSLKDLSRNNVKSFCLIHQINQYDGNGNVSILIPTHVRCNLDKFLKNIKASSDIENKLKKESRGKILLKNGYDCHAYSNIFDIAILYDDKRDLQRIKLSCTHCAYELKKEIDRTHLFYGFLCQTAICNLAYAPQTIELHPYIINR